MAGTSGEAITGKLGVGAVAFFGLFLLVDGANHSVFPLIETMGKSVTWGIIGVLPTVVVTYIVGVLCVGVAEWLLARAPSLAPPKLEAVVAVSVTGSALLQDLFAEQLRNHELLKGSFVSFVILAIGCVAESSNISGSPSVMWLFAGASLVLATMALVFSRRAADRAEAIAAAARTLRGAPASN